MSFRGGVAPVSGPGGLVKTGPGSLTVSGTQNYATGSGLVVAAGTLNLNSTVPGNVTTGSLSLTANSTANINANARFSALQDALGVSRRQCAPYCSTDRLLR